MWLDGDGDKEVSRRTTIDAGMPLARNSQFLAGVDSGRNLDFDFVDVRPFSNGKLFIGTCIGLLKGCAQHVLKVLALTIHVLGVLLAENIGK